jgi:hypothetical protein
LDGSLLQNDLERFHQQVRRAYAVCGHAVNDELARHRDHSQPSSQPPNQPPAPGRPQNGSNGAGYGNSSTGQKASAKQLDYAQRLAGQVKGLGTRRLEGLAQKMFRKPLPELSSLEASSLIDTLKEFKAGTLKLGSALNGDST